MSPQDIQDFRVQRLQELLDRKFNGVKVDLARAAGHKTGAFIRQMLERERPISEKTVAAFHEIPGCAGWFDLAPKDLFPPVMDPQSVRMAVADLGSSQGRVEFAEVLAESLGDALEGLPRNLYERAIAACRRLAESPDSQGARSELWDVLQHTKPEKPVEVSLPTIWRAAAMVTFDALKRDGKLTGLTGEAFAALVDHSVAISSAQK